MKKFIAFCLATIMVFCLCACSNVSAMTDTERASFQCFINSVKDPTSIILYGDILVIENTQGTTLQFHYNAKNGFGAYVGNTIGQIHNVSGDILCCNEDSRYFVDISWVTEPSGAQIAEANNLTVRTISGEDVAEEFGLQWIALS